MFDRMQVRLNPILERGHDLLVSQIRPLNESPQEFNSPGLSAVAQAIQAARAIDRPVILLLGGHPIKLGLSRFLIDLMERRLVTHVATNGAGIIHDFELATVGGTSESVAKWIAVGQFGLWKETSQLNDILAEASRRGEGLGEGVGRFLEETTATHREISLCAAGWRLGIPVTSHVTFGGDIIHAHPNARGSVLGAVSDVDFLVFTQAVRQLQGGVFLNVGSAVTGPEVFLKALSMARNVAQQSGERVDDFTTAVFDLVALPSEYRQGPPGKEHPLYYYRPWKTLLCRTVSQGTAHYIQGEHQLTIPALWNQLTHNPH